MTARTRQRYAYTPRYAVPPDPGLLAAQALYDEAVATDSLRDALTDPEGEDDAR